MCLLFAVSSNNPSYLDTSFAEFLKFSTAHKDGWGIAFLADNGTPHIIKEPMQAAVSGQPSKLLDAIKSKLFIAHLRQASMGDNTLENTHPFSFTHNEKTWIFAHNGTLYPKEKKDEYTKQLLKDNPFKPRGDTDSEAFFAYIMKLIAEGKEPVNALSEAISTVKQWHTYNKSCKDGGLNIMLTDGNGLYFHRKNRSLYYAEQERNITVCSETLPTQNGWREVEEDKIYSINNGIIEKY